MPGTGHTHVDTGDTHEILTEVDNWDLIVHRRETTHVPNRRNVQVGSLEDQSKPHTGTDGFLCHIRIIIVTISVKVNSEDDMFSVIVPGPWCPYQRPGLSRAKSRQTARELCRARHQKKKSIFSQREIAATTGSCRAMEGGQRRKRLPSQAGELDDDDNDGESSAGRGRKR